MLKQLVRKSTLALALGVVALSTLMLADTRGGTPELANAQPPPGVETGTREIDPQFRKANAPIKLVDEQGLPLPPTQRLVPDLKTSLEKLLAGTQKMIVHDSHLHQLLDYEEKEISDLIEWVRR